MIMFCYSLHTVKEIYVTVKSYSVIRLIWNCCVSRYCMSDIENEGINILYTYKIICMRTVKILFVNIGLKCFVETNFKLLSKIVQSFDLVRRFVTKTTRC